MAMNCCWIWSSLLTDQNGRWQHGRWKNPKPCNSRATECASNTIFNVQECQVTKREHLDVQRSSNADMEPSHRVTGHSPGHPVKAYDPLLAFSVQYLCFVNIQHYRLLWNCWQVEANSSIMKKTTNKCCKICCINVDWVLVISRVLSSVGLLVDAYINYGSEAKHLGAA